MRVPGENTLDCQQCGDVVRRLTEAEARQVAGDPMRFVVYCATCQRKGVPVPKHLGGGILSTSRAHQPLGRHAGRPAAHL